MSGTTVKLLFGRPRQWHKVQDHFQPLREMQHPSDEATNNMSVDEELAEAAGSMSIDEEDTRVTSSDASPSQPTDTTTAASTSISSAVGTKYTPVVLTIQPPKGAGRASVDMCCVIDVSGSMGMEATIQSATGTTESHGLSLLDIAKHGIRTVINTLGDNDRLSLVLFNHSSQLVFGLTKMDEAGRKMATEKLNELGPGGGTNIWEGLEAGLNALREVPETSTGASRIGHIMLLTDGQTMQRDSVMTYFDVYKKKHESLPGTVSTFGFGYNIDSELLCQIAHFGEGTYSFIPDAGFVGTVFVKTLSNLLVTTAREVTVALDFENCELEAVLGQHKMLSGKHVSMGTLQYEQERSLVFLVKESGMRPIEVTAGVNFQAAHACDKPEPAEINLADVAVDAAAEPELLRCRYIDTVQAILDAMRKSSNSGALEFAQKLMADLALEIEASPAAGKPEVQALLEDVKGQSAEAVSKMEWFSKWGVHYLPSIMFAHRAQQSNNFKDPSVQGYGGEVFQAMVDTADDIFNSLPAPEPSVRRPMSAASSLGSSSRAPPQPVSMAAYNDRYGVCIDASSLAKLVTTGRLAAIGELRPGDVVAAPDGATAEVICIVRTECAGSKALLVELPGGARVTPFHPISWAGEWRFPADVAAAKETECQAVCSVVLRGAPAMLVGFEPMQGRDDASQDAPSVACVALGHGLEAGAARHTYFGTPRVLEDLACAPGYESGLVEVCNDNVIRDVHTGLVCGFNFAQ